MAATMAWSGDVLMGDSPAESHTAGFSMAPALSSATTSSDDVPMEDSPADSHTAALRIASLTSSDDTTGYTTAQPDAIPDTTVTPQALAQLNAATSIMSLTERKAAPSTTPDPSDLPTPEANPWPRLHLLGLPRELRDQIWRYAVVSDEPVNIGPSWGRRKHFTNTPALTQASRQLRAENRRIFLAENKIAFRDFYLLTSLSPKPFHAFKALYAGSQLQHVEVLAERSCGPHRGPKLHFRATLILRRSKNGRGLEYEFQLTRFAQLNLRGVYLDVCWCRVERLASQYGGEVDDIIRVLEALRQAYVEQSHDGCDETRWYGEHFEHYDCPLSQKEEWCPDHPHAILF